MCHYNDPSLLRGGIFSIGGGYGNNSFGWGSVGDGEGIGTVVWDMGVLGMYELGGNG